MRPPRLSKVVLLKLGAGALALTLGNASAAPRPPLAMPWRAAGLTPEQAAAFLLDRFAYGPRPGEVERVAAMGPEVWMAHQLAGELPEPRLERELAPLRSLTMTTAQTFATYPPRTVVLREARAAGVVPGKNTATLDDGEEETGADVDPEELRATLRRYAARRGYLSQRAAIEELVAAKVWRAVDAENQLREVLTDFWFNHFNVSLTKNRARPFVASFERDAIRPHVLGTFRELLGATAKHPAMLLYLDNAASTAAEDASTTLSVSLRARDVFGGFGGRGARALGGRGDRMLRGTRRPDGKERPRGVNENYARELMELHTLGVDGGYTQQDVVDVARALTGWTVVPPRALRPDAGERIARAVRADVGFAVDGDFLFRADAHDAGSKRVLGHTLPAGRGIEDGEEVLDILAAHPSTARLIARQLATRFVNDTPPPALVDRLAKTFLGTHGDLAAMVREIAVAPEFWAEAKHREKIKSPFELAASSLRALGATVDDPLDTARWIARMGQPPYAYQAPTGWPDRAAQWVNSGALLNRMNFGLELAAGRIDGVHVDLAHLTTGGEAASQREALERVMPKLLPQRPTADTLRELEPMLGNPDLARRLAEAKANTPPDALDTVLEEGVDRGSMVEHTPRQRPSPESSAARRVDPPHLLLPEGGTSRGSAAAWVALRASRDAGPARRGMRHDGGFGKGLGWLSDREGAREKSLEASYPPPTPLAEVVGLILGSPEFQRR